MADRKSLSTISNSFDDHGIPIRPLDVLSLTFRYFEISFFGALHNIQSSSSLSFGLFPVRGRHSRYLHFYYMAFVLRSDALPATKPLFGGKTGPPVFHIKAGAFR